MAFSLFSVILILCVGAAVFVEVVRGMKRGFARAALGLAAILLSAIGALAGAVWVSRLVAAPLSSWLIELLGTRIEEIAEYRELLPELDSIVTALLDMLLGPLLFLAFFMLLRLLARIVLHGLASGYARPAPADPRRPAKHAALGSPTCPDYEGADGSWFRRHDRALGGVLGAVAGLLVSICLFSPLTGMLRVTATAYDGLNDMGLKWKMLRIDQQKLDRALSPFLDDVVIRTLGALGGQALYDATSSSTLNGETIVLQEELEAGMVIAADAVDVMKILRRSGRSNEEQAASLKTLGEHIDTSCVMRVVAADFIKGASGQWLEHEQFLTVKRPECGMFVDPLMDYLLSFLHENADPDYVSEDISTMLGIYFIALDNGLLDNPDTEELMLLLGEGSVLDDIYAELEHNPRMTGLVNQLTTATMQIMARAIHAVELPVATYDAYMDDLAEAVTLVNGMEGAEFADRVNTMTSYAVHYANQYGVSLPSSVAQMAVTAMMDQFSGRAYVPGREMKAYVEYFLQDAPQP